MEIKRVIILRSKLLIFRKSKSIYHEKHTLSKEINVLVSKENKKACYSNLNVKKNIEDKKFFLKIVQFFTQQTNKASYSLDISTGLLKQNIDFFFLYIRLCK